MRCPSKVKTFLGWSPLEPSSQLEDSESYMLSFPGYVAHEFHSNTQFQKVLKNDPDSEKFTFWVEAEEMLN